MNAPTKKILIVLVFAVCLTGCDDISNFGKHNCVQGLCVEVKAVGVIRPDQPVLVTVKVNSNKMISGLGISVAPYPSQATIEPLQGWGTATNNPVIQTGQLSKRVDLEANNPMVFASMIHFPRCAYDGTVEVLAYALTPSGMLVSDSVRIYMTQTGGTPYYSGTRIPITPNPLPTRILNHTSGE